MKNPIKYFFIPLFSFIIFLYLFPSSATADQNEVDIQLDPSKYFMQVNNLKPGDTVNKKLVVQNKGEQNFTYNAHAKFKTGSKKLYEQFLLQVSDSKGTLFKGKLKDFEKFQPRFLKAGHQEDIEFRIEFPFELGNEYQGLGFEYELQFIVEGNSSSPVPDNTDQRPISQEELASPPAQGKILPKTATSMFNLLAVGLILLVFGSALFLYQKRKQAH